MLSDRTKIGIAIIIVITLLVFYLGTVSSMSFFVNNTSVGDESKVNFLDGNNTSVTVVHDALNARMDVTINASSTAGTVGGSNGQVQFNLEGTFAGDTGLTFATSTDALTVVGPIFNTILDCTGFVNDGAITATSTGEFICSDDDGGGGSAYDTIEDEDSALTQFNVLNFIGAGVTCANGASQTDCTIPGGGGNAWDTIDTPSGTDPVADTASDSIQWLITGSDLTITGADDPETITFDVVTNAGTDITADLEEETHTGEHDIGGADEVTFYGLVDDEGTPLTARRTLNFTGAGVTCVDDGGGAETDCDIPGGGGGGYDTIEDEDSALTQFTVLNFTGAGVVCTNGASQTDCTIAGGSASSFTTWDTPSGTDPVADVATDSIQFLITGSDLTITGANDPETITFDIVTNAGTDITADLEEETHADEHAQGGADVNITERHLVFFISGDITTGVKQIRFVLRRAVTYKDAHCEVQTQGTTSAIEINFQEDGTDIFTDGERISISALSDGDTSSTPTDTTGAADEVIEIIIDSADSGDTGADLTCELRFRHAVDDSL